MTANLINTDQIAVLFDNDGDKVDMWDHAPSASEIQVAIRGYRYRGHAPFVLFLAARKEVWEFNAGDESVDPYKIFEQTNEVIANSVTFGERKVVVR